MGKGREASSDSGWDQMWRGLCFLRAVLIGHLLVLASDWRMGISTFLLIVPLYGPHQQGQPQPPQTKDRSMIRDCHVTFLAWNSPTHQIISRKKDSRPSDAQFLHLRPGIAVMEGVLLWLRERENFWMRPDYGVFGGHFIP